MSTGGINSSKPLISEFKTDNKVVDDGNKKSPSLTASNPGLKALLLKCKSGVKGAPGKIKGHFQSLRSKPAEITPELVSKKAKAYSIEASPPTDAGQKIQLAIDAEIAAFPYHQSLEKITNTSKLPESLSSVDKEVAENPGFGEWDTARPLALAAGKATGLSTKGAKGFIYDKKSGLTAYILHNPTAKPTPEVRLVFGGTTSGKEAGGLAKRSILNGGFTLKQWIANGKNAALGKTPDSYKQASELTRQVMDLMAKDPKYKDYSFTVSGHSKGGGEAAYAALTQKKPVNAICFSSAEFGKEMRESIPEEKRANAASHVHHYYIEGDPVPKMSDERLIKATGSKLGHIGKVTELPADGKGKGIKELDRHDQFNRHIRNFAGE